VRDKTVKMLKFSEFCILVGRRLSASGFKSDEFGTTGVWLVSIFETDGGDSAVNNIIVCYLNNRLRPLHYLYTLFQIHCVPLSLQHVGYSSIRANFIFFQYTTFFSHKPLPLFSFEN
jgi:hypothetical protein